MPPSFVRQYIEKLETRIAELEKAAATMNELREAAEIDAIRQAMRVSALEAENQRLREASRAVVDKALRHSFLEGPVEEAIDRLAAVMERE